MIVFYKPRSVNQKNNLPTKKKKVKSVGGILIREVKRPIKSVVKPSEDITKTVEIINDAIENSAILSFIYVTEKGEEARDVEPYEVKQLNNNLILYAFCIKNEGIRAFVIKNIKNIEKSRFSFQPRFNNVQRQKT
jgi:predicted DNA-binding transcriptional regulator YafY